MVQAVCVDLNKFCGDLSKGIKQKLSGKPLQDLLAKGEKTIHDYEQLLDTLEDTYKEQVRKKYGHFIDIARDFVGQLKEMDKGKSSHGSR